MIKNMWRKNDVIYIPRKRKTGNGSVSPIPTIDSVITITSNGTTSSLLYGSPYLYEINIDSITDLEISDLPLFGDDGWTPLINDLILRFYISKTDSDPESIIRSISWAFSRNTTIGNSTFQKILVFDDITNTLYKVKKSGSFSFNVARNSYAQQIPNSGWYNYYMFADSAITDFNSILDGITWPDSSYADMNFYILTGNENYTDDDYISMIYLFHNYATAQTQPQITIRELNI